jgi:hypothetical protein
VSSGGSGGIRCVRVSECGEWHRSILHIHMKFALGSFFRFVYGCENRSEISVNDRGGGTYDILQLSFEINFRILSLFSRCYLLHTTPMNIRGSDILL